MDSPERTDETGYYMVRAMDGSDEDFRVFFENDAVAVGWSRVDFTEYDDPSEAAEAMVQRYYDDGETVPQVVGRKRNEAKRFAGLEDGDRIVVPYGQSVRLAIAKGEATYDPDAPGTWTMANQHLVDYVEGPDGLVSIPRSDLSNVLQRRLRVRGMTVSNLAEFADEIERLFEEGEQGAGLARAADIEEQKADAFTTEILRRLREGEVYHDAGGRGLEELVAELLTIDGYQTKILPKQAFEGRADADIRASKSDRFYDTTLLVQVKAHKGTAGSYGVEQLEELRRLHEEEEGAQLALVTTASADEELRDRCDKEDITLMEGEDVADWIRESLEDLDGETRWRLGISEVPELLSWH